MEVETSVVRTILHRRDIPKDQDIDEHFDPISGKVSRWEVFNISETFSTKEENTSYEPPDFAMRHIHRCEDGVLINGAKFLGISGILETPTVKRDLYNVMKKSAPCMVISSSKWLNPKIDGVVALYSFYVPKYQYLVIPAENGKVSPKIAEFVVSQDINEKVSKSENPANFDEPWMHIVNEWVAIEIHDFNKIIKVTR